MTLRVGDRAPTFIFTDHTGTRRDLGDLHRSPRPVVLVFGRYAGCPLCQLEIARLGAVLPRLAQVGAALIILTQSPVERLGGLVNLAPGATIASDPWGDIYRIYNVRVGTPLQYAGASILAKVRAATAAGYVHGPREGQERQLPAAFVIAPGGKLVFVHYGKTVADAPNPEHLVAAAILAAP
jgi:peroxiredoxin Q/BCP